MSRTIPCLDCGRPTPYLEGTVCAQCGRRLWARGMAHSTAAGEPVLTVELLDDCRAFLADYLTAAALLGAHPSPEEAAMDERAQKLLRQLDARKARR